MRLVARWSRSVQLSFFQTRMDSKFLTNDMSFTIGGSWVLAVYFRSAKKIIYFCRQRMNASASWEWMQFAQATFVLRARTVMPSSVPPIARCTNPLLAHAVIRNVIEPCYAVNAYQFSMKDHKLMATSLSMEIPIVICAILITRQLTSSSNFIV